jgi:hypothetical protein
MANFIENPSLPVQINAPLEPQRIPLSFVPKRYVDNKPVQYVLHMNSEMADSWNNGPSSYNIKLTSPITAYEDESLYIECINVAIPYSFYGVSTLNNTVTITESDEDGSNAKAPFDIVLTSGNYDYQLLLNEMQDQLNAKTNHAIVYALSYNSGTNKFTFATATPNKKAVFDFNLENSCYNQYGFSLASHTMTTSIPLTSNNVMESCSIYNLFIRLKNFNLDRAFDMLNKSTSNIICKVPVNVPPLGVIYSSDTNSFQTPIKGSLIQNMTFEITDEWERLIDLNGKSWTFDLLITINKKLTL